MAEFKNFNINGTDVSINANAILYNDTSTQLGAIYVQNAINKLYDTISEVNCVKTATVDITQKGVLSSIFSVPLSAGKLFYVKVESDEANIQWQVYSTSPQWQGASILTYDLGVWKTCRFPYDADSFGINVEVFENGGTVNIYFKTGEIYTIDSSISTLSDSVSSLSDIVNSNTPYTVTWYPSTSSRVFQDSYINADKSESDITDLYVYVKYTDIVKCFVTYMQNDTTYIDNTYTTNTFIHIKPSIPVRNLRFTINYDAAIEGEFATAWFMFDTIDNSITMQIEDKVNTHFDNEYKVFKSHKMIEWNDLQFGLFIHWGVYSAWAGTYTGLNMNGDTITYSDREWILYNGQLDRSTYMAKQTEFTADGFDPDQICRLAKSVGMKYIILTIRHHDGFSLAESDYCDWNVSTSGAAGVDIIKLLKTSCRKYDLKLGLYYSYFVNWTEEGGYNQALWNSGTDPYTDEEHYKYVQKQVNYINDIINRYDPFVIWYDNGPSNSNDSARLLFANNQEENFPYIISNDRGVWNTDYKSVEDVNPDEPTIDYVERCTGLPAWGYNASTDDDASNYPTLTSKLWSFVETFSRGFNYLLNIGPKGDGSICEPVITWFNSLSVWQRKYTFFNGCKRLFYYAQPSWGRILYKPSENVMYAIVFNGESTIQIDSINTDNIKSVTCYGNESGTYNIVDDYTFTITGLTQDSDTEVSVAKIELYNDAVCNDYINYDSEIKGMSLVRLTHQTWTSYTCVNMDGRFYFGPGSTSFAVRFKSNVSTGNYKVSINGTFTGTETYSVTLKDKFGNTISSFDLYTASGTTAYESTDSIALTQYNIYTLEASKTSSSSYAYINTIQFIAL